MEVKRRSQADRSAATREALVAAGRALFSVHGFAGVGTETIVRQAGVTRGALYHQFADKTELFAAVFEDVEQTISARIGQAAVDAGVTDPIEAMALGAGAWLDASTDPQVRQIVLLDAPAVLGWERWREIGMRYGMGLVEGLLEHAITVGPAAAPAGGAPGPRARRRARRGGAVRRRRRGPGRGTRRGAGGRRPPDRRTGGRPMSLRRRTGPCTCVISTV